MSKIEWQVKILGILRDHPRKTTFTCACGHRLEIVEDEIYFDALQRHVAGVIAEAVVDFNPTRRLHRIYRKDIETGWSAALDAVLSIRADNAQFGLPKWVKNEVNKLRARRLVR